VRRVDHLAHVVSEERAIEARYARDPKPVEHGVAVAKIVGEHKNAAVLDKGLKRSRVPAKSTELFGLSMKRTPLPEVPIWLSVKTERAV
jgi:hypothetical protein